MDDQTTSADMMADTQDDSMSSDNAAADSKTTGVVKTFIEDKGYGFIAVVGQEKDVFFHFSELNGAQVREGDNVKFDQVQDVKGLKAKNVEVVE